MTCLLKFREVGAVQKSVNLVDLVKSFHKSTHLQKSAAIQPRTLSPLPRFGGASQFHPFLHPAPSPHSRTPEPVPAAPPPPPCVSAVLSMAFWYLDDLPFFWSEPSDQPPCARTPVCKDEFGICFQAHAFGRGTPKRPELLCRRVTTENATFNEFVAPKKEKTVENIPR